MSIPVKEFKTIQEGFRIGSFEPFFVRNPVEFRNLTEAYARTRIKETNYTMVAISANNEVRNFSLVDLVDSFDRHRLKFTPVYPSVNLVKVPQILVDSHENDKNEPYEQILLLDSLETEKKAHYNPLAHGGGAMYQWQGEKYWEFLAPEFAPLLYNHEEESIINVTKESWIKLLETFDVKINNYDDLLKSNDARVKKMYPPGYKLQGPLSIARVFTLNAKPFDFVYFPPAWIHRYTTNGNNFGIAWDIRTKSYLKRLEQIKKIFLYGKMTI